MSGRAILGLGIAHLLAAKLPLETQTTSDILEPIGTRKTVVFRIEHAEEVKEVRIRAEKGKRTHPTSWRKGRR
jgi:hypothetical protein